MIFKRLNGAESYDYRVAGYDYGPRNFDMQVMEEVFLLKDFSPLIFLIILKKIIVFSGDATRHKLYGDEWKICSGLCFPGDSMVDRILELRETKALTPSLFRNVSPVLPVPGRPQAFFRIRMDPSRISLQQ